MFDIGWTEMLVLGVVTLLVVGPRELPALLRSAGRFVGRMRAMVQELRAQMNDMSDDLDPLRDHPFVEDVGTPDLFVAPDEDDEPKRD